MKHTKQIKQQKDEFDKKVRRASKRINELWKLKNSIPLEPLPQPVQRGFVKTFVLRDDIARRRDAHDFKRILSEINAQVYCKTPDFKVTKWKTGQKVDMQHTVGYISEHRWEKLDWPSHFKKHFIFTTRHRTSPSGFTFTYKGWFFKNEYYFASKVEPHFVTHRRPVNVDIEREKAELEAFMNNNHGWERLSKLHGSSYRRYDFEKPPTVISMEERFHEEMKEFEYNYLEAPTE